MTEATEIQARLDGYASALFDVARAEGDVDSFVDAFYAAAKTISANSELRDVLINTSRSSEFAEIVFAAA